MSIHKSMPCLRHKTIGRQYRLANLILVVGMFGAGEFALTWLSGALRHWLAGSAGIATGAWDAHSRLVFQSLTLGDLTVAVTGIVGVAGFALIEWRRGRQLQGHTRRCQADRRLHSRVERLGLREQLDIF